MVRDHYFHVILDRLPTPEEEGHLVGPELPINGLEWDDTSRRITASVIEKGESLEQAVTKTLDLLNSVGINVFQVLSGDEECEGEFYDEVAVEEIAARVGFSVSYVEGLISGLHGPGGFPGPVPEEEPFSFYMWHWLEVQNWFRTHFGPDVADKFSTQLGAINAKLLLKRD